MGRRRVVSAAVMALVLAVPAGCGATRIAAPAPPAPGSTWVVNNVQVVPPTYSAEDLKAIGQASAGFPPGSEPLSTGPLGTEPLNTGPISTEPPEDADTGSPAAPVPHLTGHTVTAVPVAPPVVHQPATQAPVTPAPAMSGPNRAPQPGGHAQELGTSPAPECTGNSLNVVAHQDDDLLFINPAVSDDIAGARCVTTVFVTAGDSGRPRSYWGNRELGSMAAYAAASGLPDDWSADTFFVNGHTMARFRLTGAPITLLFMRLPDAHGGLGRPAEGLQRLWRGDLDTLRSVTGENAYTKAGLISTLTATMDSYRPDTIRTLDFAGRYGDGDHADHHTAGYLAYVAQQSYAVPHRIIGYLGYPAAERDANLTDAVRDRKISFFLAYAPYDSKVCQSYENCMANFYGPRFGRSVPIN